VKAEAQLAKNLVPKFVDRVIRVKQQNPTLPIDNWRRQGWSGYILNLL